VALTDSLIESWELDEASGDATGSHAGKTLTETSGTIGSAAGPGGSGGSRDIELGDSEWFQRADDNDLDGGDFDFTFEAWINLESKATVQDILGKWDGSQGYLLLYNSGTDRFEWYCRSTGAGSTGVATANNLGSPSAGTWYQLIVEHDAAANEVRIRGNNGTADTAAFSAGVGPNADPFIMGERQGGTNGTYVDGLLAKCRRWDRLLTSDERSQLYNGGSGLAYTSFVSSQGARRRRPAATLDGPTPERPPRRRVLVQAGDEQPPLAGTRLRQQLLDAAAWPSGLVRTRPPVADAEGLPAPRGGKSLFDVSLELMLADRSRAWRTPVPGDPTAEPEPEPPDPCADYYPRRPSEDATIRRRPDECR
jgi:hypothetical protein